MGILMFIIPVLFVLICGSFMAYHHCYIKSKVSKALRKKREAAKISLVNILQLTNPNLMTPYWISNGVKQQPPEKPPSGNTPIFKATPACPQKCVHFAEKKEDSFDPRNPKVLSSVVILGDALDSPPCYEELFGAEGGQEPAVFPNDGIVLPPIYGLRRDENDREGESPTRGGLQVPEWPPERRNSSAVLYL